MKKLIKKIIKEELSSRQEKIFSMIKTIGIVSTSNAVGGFDNLNKILNLDLDDIDTQEMLVKNFIYFYDQNVVEIDSLDIRKSNNGNKIITINGTTTDGAANIESWFVLTMCDEANLFFPFRIDASWRPVFQSKGIKIFLDAELLYHEG